MRSSRSVAIAAAVSAALVLSGCFRAEFDISVDDDGTADLSVLTAIDVEEFGELGELFGDDAGVLPDVGGDELFEELIGSEDPCGDLVGDLDEFEPEVEEISDGSEVGVRCTVRDVPLEELTSVGEDSSLRVEQDDDGTRFEATLGGLEQLTGGADGLDLGAIPGFDLDEIVRIRFAVSAPGSLGDNNASSTDGSTAIWEITPDADFVTGGQAVMDAEWTPGGGASSRWWIAAIVIVGLVVAAVIAVMLTRGRKMGASPASVGGPPPPPPSSAAPPPPPSAAPPPPPSGPPSSAPPPPPPPPTGD